MASLPESLENLPQPIKDRLSEIGKSPHADWHVFANELSHYYPGENVISLAQAAEHTYRPVLANSQEQKSTFHEPKISGGGMVGAVAAGVGAALTRDTSGSDKIISAIHAEQRDSLFGDKSPFAEAITSGVLYEEQLDQLSSESLMHQEYQSLENHVREAGKTAGLSEVEISQQVADLRTKYDEQLRKRATERNNPNKSKKQLQEEKQQQALQEQRKKRLSDELKAVDGETVGNGGKKRLLTEEEKRTRRRQILEQYTREQQRKNYTSLQNLLSKKGLLGLHKLSAIPKIKRELLNRTGAKKTGSKGSPEASTEENRESPLEQLDRLRRLHDEVQRVGDEFPNPKTSLETPIPQTPIETPAPSAPPTPPARLGFPGMPFSIGGADIAGALFPYIAIGLGILALVFLIVLIVLIIANGSGSTWETDKYHQLQCGDMRDIGTTNNPDTVEKAFDNRYSTIIQTAWQDLSGAPSPTALANNDTVVAVQSQLFSDICVLFGHVLGDTYQDPNKPSVFNDFGTYAIGTAEQRKPENRGQLLMFKYVLYINGPQDKTCSIKLQGSPGGNLYLWQLHVLTNPDNTIACPGGLPQLQFLIAQSLTHSLILQQLHLHNTVKVYNDFVTYWDPTDPSGKKTRGVISYDGLLPTNGCQNTIDIGDHSLNDTQTVDCFSDMVGSYYTYPFYLDTSPVPAPSPKPSTTPSPQKKQTFVDYPNTYTHYYNFAKTELFNGKDLVVNISSASGSVLADTATSVVNAFHAGPNPPCAKNVSGWTRIFYSLYGDDFSCKDHVSPPPSATIWKWFSASAVQNAVLQCVGFVQAITAQVGHFVGVGKGCAVNYGNPPYPPDYVFNRVTINHPRFLYDYTLAAGIQPGDIVIWDWGSCGHIAIVTKIVDTGQRKGHPYTKFEVAEANAHDDGAMDLGNQYSDFAIEGYYRLKSN